MEYLYVNKLHKLVELLNDSPNYFVRAGLLQAIASLSVNTSNYNLCIDIIAKLRAQIAQGPEPAAKPGMEGVGEMTKVFNGISSHSLDIVEERVKRIMEDSFNDGDSLKELASGAGAVAAKIVTEIDPTRLVEVILTVWDEIDKDKKRNEATNNDMMVHEAFANKQLVSALLLKKIWLGFKDDRDYTLEELRQALLDDLRKFDAEYPSFLKVE